MKCLGVIPSRYGSSRFPGKPLIDLGGKTMIQRVYEKALKSKLLSDLVVATDDNRIADVLERLHIPFLMTSSQLATGTDRVAAVAELKPEFDVYANIQGDEPFLHPAQVDELLQPFFDNPEVNITTVAKILDRTEDLFNPNSVKVVMNKKGYALYFSRSPIPHCRETSHDAWLSRHTYYRHLGLYAFKKNILKEIKELPQSGLEITESLEQLRWLENGYSIFVNETSHANIIAIDSPADYERALHWLQQHPDA
jgi:3-deoxy-manno-octulosonate cytidylyltransferase (CMP-KDO synthetase)